MLITISEDMAAQKGFPLAHQPLTQSTSAPTRRESPAAESAAGERRVRVLRLHRPLAGSYGFHLRGGREHGTGFFISHVELASEADSKGLRVGDQVLKVNHLNVGRALHREVASIVQHHQEIVLEVKSTGLIPVKNNPNDPLSWVMVREKEGLHQPNDTQLLNFLNNSHGTMNSNISVHNSSHNPLENTLQIAMSGAGKYTIGCSICKGPPDKPGIFVQRVREGGVAEEAGLRPGDQILSCNGTSFLYIDFQQAVQIMKSSPNLRMEVLRGAGMDLIAGESSGYNSSASSETGEELYPSSENDTREGFSSLASNLSSRIANARNHLHLDRSRDWKEIEAEWEEAEVIEKRTQLKNSHTLLARKNTTPSDFLTASKSLLSLTIRENEAEPRKQPISKESVGHQQPLHRRNLSKQRSLSDLNLAKDPCNYKIALQTSSDAHVSKIVIPSAPKDQQNALLRLEELSSSTSSLKNTTKKDIYQNHSKTSSISSSSSEEFPHQINQNSFSQLRRRQEDNRQVRVCSKEKRLPKPVSSDSLLNSEESDSLSNYPSSRICITSENGRFTSKVIIRSPPPAPPPRANNTKLSRQQKKMCPYRHHKVINNRLMSTNSYLNIMSPPVSPSTSTGSSNEGLSCGHLVRHKSFGNLSISSEESVSPWEEVVDSSLSSHCSIQVTSSSGSKEPSLSKHSTLPIGQRRSCTYSDSFSIPIPPIKAPSSVAITGSSSKSTSSSKSSLIPAPPPPPPPPPLPNALNNSINTTTANVVSLGAAINKELKSRQEQDVMGAVSKLRSPSERPNRPNAPINDPKKQQHEQLMEEFKKAHALMFRKKKASVEQNCDEPQGETETSHL